MSLLVVAIERRIGRRSRAQCVDVGFMFSLYNQYSRIWRYQSKRHGTNRHLRAASGPPTGFLIQVRACDMHYSDLPFSRWRDRHLAAELKCRFANNCSQQTRPR